MAATRRIGTTTVSSHQPGVTDGPLPPSPNVQQIIDWNDGPAAQAWAARPVGPVAMPHPGGCPVRRPTLPPSCPRLRELPALVHHGGRLLRAGGWAALRSICGTWL